MGVEAVPSPLHVLVVDDEEDIVVLFRQRFRRAIKSGALVFVFAHTGEEALAYLRGDGCAELVLILSDINMPGMNGHELLRRLKAEWPAIPVYLITAYDDAENRAQAVAGGADGFLAKPLDFEALRGILEGLNQPGN